MAKMKRQHQASAGMLDDWNSFTAGKGEHSEKLFGSVY